MLRRLWSARPALPLGILVLLNFIYWSKVIMSGGVYLPGRMLTGFAPFGGNADAPWNILHWDALGQYYPWRHFAAQMLHQGTVPLWNPYQFSGAPFVANLQSAVFYPLNLPFWIFNTTYAFAITAILHTLLATFSMYFLAQRWNMSRPASLLAAVGFGFCGYIAAWFTLPTLANTACWLPLLLLLLERSMEVAGEKRLARLGRFSAALACALLAGHVQIFLYLVFALLIRALFLAKPARALGSLLVGGVWSFALAALQILPTLELARLGHRSASTPTVEAWQQFIVPRALQWGDLPSLFVPRWPFLSFNENIGYVGGALCLLALAGVGVAIAKRSREGGFAAVLAVFGLLYALATPLAEAVFLYVPGVAQMGGPGRALLLWSFGAATLAALALDGFIKREQRKSTFDEAESTAKRETKRAVPKSSFAISAIVLIVVLGELYGFAHMTQPIAPASTIYPRTALTDWLRQNLDEGERLVTITPRGNWLPSEVLEQHGRNHPSGALPPNGAMVYALPDINGYDSLAPKAYRDFLVEAEGEDVSPPLNGNMILVNNLQSPALDMLRVRYVVTAEELPAEKVLSSGLQKVWEGEGAVVYRREINQVRVHRNGKDFYPGWSEGVYQPTTFRLGTFISLVAWMLVGAAQCYCCRSKR